jgi:dipeptide/tripeptide permease
MATATNAEQPTLFGHPTGLFLLFFAEMWERFSYYGMRALLIFYMIKGFLAYEDNEAYKVYGAYVGLVYMTPFFGGMLADRLLGAKRAVILGGLFMAAGHLLMTVEDSTFFFSALALLIIGNGFFKPNISTIVGSLYPDGDPRRDGGFTIFYMGINLGAAMSPLLCGYVGETYGWHYGFGLATVGMLLGLAVFMIPGFIGQTLTVLCALGTLGTLAAGFNGVLPEGGMATASLVILAALMVAGTFGFIELKREETGKPPFSPSFPQLSRYSAIALVLFGSLTTAVVMFWVQESNLVVQAVVGFVSVALSAAGIAGTIALLKGGLPDGIGLAPDPDALHKSVVGPLTLEHITFGAAALVVPAIAMLVNSNRTTKLISDAFLDGLASSESALVQLGGTLLGEMSTPTGLLLIVTGVTALAYLLYESMRTTKIERERLWVVITLMFASMMFWAFFEQAGSSMNNFTDRNVDRVDEERVLTSDEIGQTVTLSINQEQLGMVNADVGFAAVVNAALDQVATEREQKTGETDDDAYTFASGDPLTLNALDALRGTGRGEAVAWKVSADNVGMGVGGAEVRASMFQSANAIFIVIFGLVFTAMWTALGRRGYEPSTPVKFALGLLQLGLGFVALWWGATYCDPRGMVGANWLLLAYLLHTTGELCLSPVGLSMVTKLSPARLVSTTMGAWFLATAFSGFLAAIIATFTGVGHGDGGVGVPVPLETVHVYGGVFGTIGVLAIAFAGLAFLMSPILRKGMHEDVQDAAA